jgi:hypothetical protein
MARQALWAALVVGLALLCPRAAWAWGEEGHRIVARIAELNLSPSARVGIATLIGNDSIANDRISVWADFIKRNRRYRAIYPDNDRWHYINLDITNPFPTAFNDGNNAPVKIKEMVTRMTNVSLSEREQREALFFVIHLMGDVAQPLHCGDRKDLGGSRCQVTVPGDRQHVTNLHRVWDGNLVREAMGGMAVLEFADRINFSLTREQRLERQAGDLDAWIKDAFEVARDKAYAGVPKQDDPFELSDQYMDANAEVARGQLLKGGLRLAAVLNKAFD